MPQLALEAHRGGVCRRDFVPCRRLPWSSGSNAGQRPCCLSKAVASGQDDLSLHKPFARPQRPDQELTATSSSLSTEVAAPAFRPTFSSTDKCEFDELVEEACNSIDDGGNRKDILSRFATKFLDLVEGGQFRSSRLVHMLECVSNVVTKAEVHVALTPELSHLVLSLTHRIDDSLQEFSGHELSSIFRSYGKLGPKVIKLQEGDVRVREMMSHLCLQTESVVHSMDPDELSQMLWGLARMQFTHCDGLLADVVHRSAPRVKEGEFYPRQIATLVWAIGKLGFKKGPMLIRALSREAKGHMGEFTPQEIMRFLWGISQLGYRGVPSVLVAARNEVNRRAEEFSNSDLIDVTFAFARLGFDPEQKYLDKVGAWLSHDKEALSETDVTKLLHSFALLGYASDSVVEWTRDHFRSNLKTYRVKDVATFMWSLAMLDALDEGTLARGIDRITHSSEKLNATGLNQIYQTWLHLRYMNGRTVAQDAIPADLFAQSREAWLHQRKQPPVHATAAVLSALERMGYVCHKRMSIKDGDFCVDVVEDSEGRQFVLDVTILAHCFMNDHDRLRPSRQWFWDVYERLGYKILQIKEEQWKQVPQDAKGRFIQRRVIEMVPQPGNALA